MADDDHGARIAREVIGQPQRAFEVEIVGRLVEQQQVRLGEQHRGERDAHAPAAGEIRARALLRLGVEAEPGEDRRRRARAPHARRYRRAASGFRRCDADRARFRPRRAAPVRSLSAASTTSIRLSGPSGASCARRPMRARDGRSIEPCSSGSSPDDRAEQRRLADAVAPDQPDARAVRNARGRAIEQKPAGNADRNVIQNQHGAFIAAPRGLASAACSMMLRAAGKGDHHVRSGMPRGGDTRDVAARIFQRCGGRGLCGERRHAGVGAAQLHVRDRPDAHAVAGVSDLLRHSGHRHRAALHAQEGRRERELVARAGARRHACRCAVPLLRRGCGRRDDSGRATGRAARGRGCGGAGRAQRRLRDDDAGHPRLGSAARPPAR